MVSSNFSLKGVSRNRTFKDSQKKASEKTNYGQQNTAKRKRRKGKTTIYKTYT
jgi:hypothetical protein